MKQFSFWQVGLIISLLITLTETLKAQENDLNLDDIFTNPKLTGTIPSRPVWAPNSSHFAFSWNEPGIPGRGLWVSTSDGKDLRLISDTTSPSVRNIIWTDANTIISLRGTQLWKTILNQEEDFELMRVQRDAHNLSHIPFRDWCDHCVNGRSK